MTHVQDHRQRYHPCLTPPRYKPSKENENETKNETKVEMKETIQRDPSIAVRLAELAKLEERTGRQK